MKTYTHFAGSHIVVDLTPITTRMANYIDAKKVADNLHTSTDLELVINGQVRKSIRVPDTEAPETIVSWMRLWRTLYH